MLRCCYYYDKLTTNIVHARISHYSTLLPPTSKYLIYILRLVKSRAWLQGHHFIFSSVYPARGGPAADCRNHGRFKQEVKPSQPFAAPDKLVYATLKQTTDDELYYTDSVCLSVRVYVNIFATHLITFILPLLASSLHISSQAIYFNPTQCRRTRMNFSVWGSKQSQRRTDIISPALLVIFQACPAERAPRCYRVGRLRIHY